MCDESYSEWMSLYNTEMIGLWKNERKELKRIAIIYHALQIEMDRVKKDIDKNLSGIRSELAARDASQDNKPLKEISLNRTKPISPKSPNPKKIIVPECSPVLNKNGTRPKSVEDNSNMYFNVACTAQRTPKLPQKNIADDDITFIDCSIIETTPEASKPARKNATLQPKKSKKLKPKPQNTTLTQIFIEPVKKKKKWDLENIPADLEIEEIIEIINQDGSESDENKAEKIPKEGVLKSFVDGYNKVVDNKVEQEGVVRGKERKKLKGWSCQECKEFYEKLDLPEEELEKKMDACSRHRGKYRQRDETYEGFWDLTLECTPPTQEQSLILNYKK